MNVGNSIEKPWFENFYENDSSVLQADPVEAEFHDEFAITMLMKNNGVSGEG